MSEPQFVYWCDGKNPPVKLDMGDSGWKLAWTPHRYYTRGNRLFYGDFSDAEWAELKRLYPDAKFGESK